MNNNCYGNHSKNLVPHPSIHCVIHYLLRSNFAWVEFSRRQHARKLNPWFRAANGARNLKLAKIKSVKIKGIHGYLRVLETHELR